MNVYEARMTVMRFYDDPDHTEEEEFLFTEALRFLIEKENDPDDMMALGGYYYERKKFDLALKYYEMAAALDYDPAYECLGYVWYYGRTGERDFKKAFEYFSKLKEKGDLVASYKIADMYRNGYHVPKDEAKYRAIIEELYPKIKDTDNAFAPLPEIFTRLAKIRAAEGKEDEAVELLLRAKAYLAARMKRDTFFGNLSIMKYLIEDLYRLSPFDPDDFDFFDLFHVLKEPCAVRFFHDGKQLEVKSEKDGGECAVCFEGKWFRSRDDFFAGAESDGYGLLGINDELYGFRQV